MSEIMFHPGGRFLFLKVTHHSIDGHVENSPGPHDIKQAVNVLENGDHHLIFVFGSWSVKIKLRVWSCLLVSDIFAGCQKTL